MSFLSSNLFAAAMEGAGKMLLDQYHNRQQWIYDKKAMDYSYNQQLDFWNKTNDYNSPVSQMQRLEEAGLNPNLVYGSGGATHQATMPTASASRGRVHASSINPLIGQQMENMEAQNELLRAQKEKTEAERDLTKKQDKNWEKDHAKVERELLSRVKEFIDRETNPPQQIDKTKPAIGRNRKPGTGTSWRDLKWFPWEW